MSRLRREGDTAADLLVVGLGNPGREFEGSRHNVGAEVVSELARRHGLKLRPGRENSLVVSSSVNGKRLVLAVPTTFMNESGRAVAPLVRRFGIHDLSALLIVHDELDLEPGRLKLKLGGGLAGHNGLRSIRDHLGDDGFARLRIGVGKPPSAAKGRSYVLKPPSRAESEVIGAAVQAAADAAEDVLADGLGPVMQVLNAR